jgi:hypothetical protein
MLVNLIGNTLAPSSIENGLLSPLSNRPKSILSIEDINSGVLLTALLQPKLINSVISKNKI